MVSVEGIQDLPTDRSQTDGMALSFVDDQDCGFFGKHRDVKGRHSSSSREVGPSSNIAFMRHILRAMARRGSIHDVLSPQSNSDIGLYEAGMIRVSRPVSSALPSHQTGEDCDSVATNLLPPEEETLRLIRAYFSNTGLLFPFIHEPSFLEEYEHNRQGNFRTNIRRTWLGLLNMILAMSVRTALSDEDAGESRFEQSDVYYRRARGLCKTQMLRGTTLETGTAHSMPAGLEP